jgi:hypothetical protein
LLVVVAGQPVAFQPARLTQRLTRAFVAADSGAGSMRGELAGRATTQTVTVAAGSVGGRQGDIRSLNCSNVILPSM